MQGAMNKLYLFSLTGMNYGNANVLDHEFTGEKKAIEYIREKTAREQELILFDVGANAGNYSILLSAVLNERNIRIYAFEPSAYSFTHLAKNMASLNNIEFYNFGFGKTEEKVTLYSNFEGSGATTLYNDAFNTHDFNKGLAEEIQIKTLNTFCKAHSVKQIHLLKIDVEGHELFVLQGANELLNQGRIKFIQFEFGPVHVYSRTFFKDFWDLLSPLYILYRIIGDGLFEIKGYSENLEVFRTANFLAALRV
jgi:FkbM family methyltransferase